MSYHLIMERVRASGLFPVMTMLREVRLHLEFRDICNRHQSVHSGLGHVAKSAMHKFKSDDLATFIVPSELIAISGYKFNNLYAR